MTQSQPQPRVLKCDFCSCTPISKSYDTAPICVQLGETVIHLFDSKWAACSICAAFIDENRWKELTDRSISTWFAEALCNGVKISPRDLAEIKEEMTRLHQRFREARRA
jgi:hypothetical protein